MVFQRQWNSTQHTYTEKKNEEEIKQSGKKENWKRMKRQRIGKDGKKIEQ